MKKNRVKIVCKQCGKTVEVKMSRANQKFCSTKCAWVGRKQAKYKDSWDWKRILKNTMKRKDEK